MTDYLLGLFYGAFTAYAWLRIITIKQLRQVSAKPVDDVRDTEWFFAVAITLASIAFAFLRGV